MIGGQRIIRMVVVLFWFDTFMTKIIQVISRNVFTLSSLHYSDRGIKISIEAYLGTEVLTVFIFKCYLYFEI